MSLPYKTAEACHAAGYEKLVALYKRVRDTSSLTDAGKWCFFSQSLKELMVLHGDPTIEQPLGVMDVPQAHH